MDSLEVERVLGAVLERSVDSAGENWEFKQRSWVVSASVRGVQRRERGKGRSITSLESQTIDLLVSVITPSASDARQTALRDSLY